MSNTSGKKNLFHSLFHGLTAGVGCLAGGAAGPGLLYLGIDILDRMYPNSEVGMFSVLFFGLIFLISMPIGAAIGIALATKFYETITTRKKQNDENGI